MAVWLVLGRVGKDWWLPIYHGSARFYLHLGGCVSPHTSESENMGFVELRSFKEIYTDYNHFARVCICSCVLGDISFFKTDNSYASPNIFSSYHIYSFSFSFSSCSTI